MPPVVPLPTRWFWITLPGEDAPAFALRAQAGRVDKAPRIASWARGLPLDEVLAYYRRRGATIEQLRP